MRKFRLGQRTAIVFCAAVLATTISPPLYAQNIQLFGGPGEGFGPGGGGEPPVNSRQLKKYAALLGLDADQQEAATALLEGMQTEWEAASRKTRDEMEAIRGEFQDNRDPSVFMERMPEIMRKQRQERTRLEKGFMSDFQSILTAEQQANWPIVERTYRRDSTIRTGRLSGESVDLVSLIDDLKLDPAALAQVRPILDQYEADLDRALVERNTVVDQAQQRAGDGPAAIERAAQDPEFQKLREKAREARLKVRDTNQRYARQIAAALPDSTAGRFNTEFTKQSFPEAFRRSHTAESLEAAMKFTDLTPDQKSALEAMQAAYAIEAERSSKALMQAIEKYEATPEGYLNSLGGGMRMRRFGGEGGDADSNSPVDEARRARRELDRKTLDNLTNLLSDDQRERLPKRRERRAGGPQALGGPGGAAILIAGDDDDDGPPPGAQMVHVVRQIELGPDGKPVEATAVLVAKLPPAEGTDDAQVDKVEIEIVSPPPAPPPAPRQPE